MFTHYLVTLLCLGGCVHFSSAQQGQQEFFFGNAAQRTQFLQQQQQQLQAAPSVQPPQFSNFFQPINSGPFSPFRSQDISSSNQPQFQSLQQSFPSQQTSFQLPPLQSSVPTSQNFNSFITSSRTSLPAQPSFQPIKPAQSSFQPSSSFRQQKQQPSFSSAPSATRSDPNKFQFSSFSPSEAQLQPSRSNFQNNIPVSTFQAPQVFSEVFQEEPPKQQFKSFINGQPQKDNIDDFTPQSRWRTTKTNTDVDTNRLQRKPQLTSRTPSPPQSRNPPFSSNSDDESDNNSSNSLGQQDPDYDESPTFFKSSQTPINKVNNFQRNKVVEPRRENISPKTRFEVSTYRPQHQFIPRGSTEDVEEEDLEDGEEEEEYDDKPINEPVRSTTQTVRTDSRYRPTTYSPPPFSKARFINNQSNRQNINRPEVTQNSQPEVTTFRQRPSKNIASNTISRGNTRSNNSVIPVTLKKQFKITGPLDSAKKNTTFDVMVLNKDNTFVAEDNFKGFVDSASIDVTEVPHRSAGEPNASDEESSGLQVSVEPTFTTKKVLPSSTSPSPSFSTVTATSTSNKPSVPTSTTQKQKTPTSVSPPDNSENPTSTESWVIVASVQTSRSVSGARFIPSGAVKQEEQPKPLAPKTKENEDDLEKTTPSRNSSSTESIIDKLDRVQSELSSDILTGGFNPSKTEENIDLDMPDKMTTESATSTPSTKPTSSEEEPSSTSRFVPASKRFTTTSKPASKSAGKSSLKDSIQFDEELVGLLPQGFKPRTFTKKSTTTTTTAATDTSSEVSGTTTPKPSGTTRSLLPKLKPKIKFEDVKAFVPPGYTPPPEVSESTSAKPALDTILSKVKFDDVSALLPPGYKPDSSATEKPSKFIPKIKFEEPTALLPKGFKPQAAAPSKNVSSILGKAKPVDISAFLPPGFKPTEEPITAEDTVKKTSVSSLNEATESTSTSMEEVSTTAASSSKVVFPSRPGSAAATRKNATASAKLPGKGGSLITQPKIQKGWPTRATTEFMGWPSPPTSTISIEELLRAAKAAATSTEGSESEAASSTSTTTTTTTTAAPTTPGYCSSDCELAATIKLVGGAKWVPELLDHNTKEWQTLANEVEEQLDAVYSSSSSLNRWYKKIRVDAFSPGSVLVDYFVELSELGRTVSTADMKRLFHESLLTSTVNSEASSQQGDYSKLKLGTFQVDPKFTDFVVLQKRQVPMVGMAEQDTLLPQWAIAVIVIGLASLLFVLIFGITVLVSRHKNAKKHPSPLTEDMLHELNKNHMGGHDNYGADDLYNMEDVWNDKPMKKRGSTAYQDNSMPNLYDSWRSDWNGYYYNAYYGGGAGGGSNHSAGYATRRRSDYDTNF